MLMIASHWDVLMFRSSWESRFILRATVGLRSLHPGYACSVSGNATPGR